MEVVGLRSSIVLAADDPAVLAAFYAALLEAESTPGLGLFHWRVPWPAAGQLEIYVPSRTRPQPLQGCRLPLCLQRSSDGRDRWAVINAWLEVAEQLRAEQAEPPRQEPFGVDAWLLAPEGNRLLLLVS